MNSLEELKEARRTKFRNDFFEELERVGIEREQFFDPVESGIAPFLQAIYSTNIMKILAISKIEIILLKISKATKSLLRKIACNK